MFKKIVSRLPFSPSLIGELGRYANNIKKEENSRRVGLILTAIALAVQSLVIFAPPESANAANPSDLVYGGLHSANEMVAACKSNKQGWGDLLNHAGITCDNIKKGKKTQINTRTKSKDNGWLSWGRVSRLSSKDGERSVTVGKQKVFVRPLAKLDTGKNKTGSGSYYDVIKGTNSRGQTFAIIMGCANIAMKEYPPVEKPPVVKEIKVCRLADKKYPVTIKEKDFNPKEHSKNPEDCKEAPKEMTVCRLADKKYPVTIKEDDFNPKEHSKNPEDCKEAPQPQPIATCSSLTAKKISRNKVNLTANASVKNGATISKYTFTVKDGSGKEVLRKEVKSTNSQASIEHELINDGDYSASVVVSTSLGDKTATACQTTFTVEPVERCPVNPELPIDSPECQPCPGDPNIWVKDEDCSAQVVRNKKATNLSQSVDATQQKAEASDRIEYTLTAKNEGKAESTISIADNLSDVLEYSSVYDRGGGQLDEKTKILSWPDVTLQPGEQQTRVYVVQLTSNISAMPRGASDPSSYDCQMINHFGNTVTVEVNCPSPKVVEQVVTELPKTGPGENMIFAGIIAAVVSYFYFRSRQLGVEVKLIRRDFTAGTI